VGDGIGLWVMGRLCCNVKRGVATEGYGCKLFFANNQGANYTRNPSTKSEKKYYYYRTTSFINYSKGRKNYAEDYTPE